MTIILKNGIPSDKLIENAGKHGWPWGHLVVFLRNTAVFARGSLQLAASFDMCLDPGCARAYVYEL